MSRHYKILIFIISIALLTGMFLAEAIEINNDTIWQLKLDGSALNASNFYSIKTATVTGIFEDGKSDNIFYIADGGGRGFVCYSKGKKISDLALGDTVNVSGYISNFWGETQIDITSAPSHVSPLDYGNITRLKKANAGGGYIPEPRIIWTRDLADMTDTTANNGRGNRGQLLEGDSVRIRRVKKVSGDWPTSDSSVFPWNFTVEDSSGQIGVFLDLKAYGLHTAVPSSFIEPQGYYDITGNVSQQKAEAPYFTQYCIRPRNEFDILDVPDDLSVHTSTADGSRELRWDPGQSLFVPPHKWFKWWNIYRSTDGTYFVWISTTEEGENSRYFRDAPNTTYYAYVTPLDINATYYYRVTAAYYGEETVKANGEPIPDTDRGYNSGGLGYRVAGSTSSLQTWQLESSPSNEIMSYPYSTPPGDITDMSETTGLAGTDGEIILTWTAPVAGAGGSYTYEVRYNTTEEITTTNWLTANVYSQSWTPVLPGFAENKTLAGLVAGATYYIGIRAKSPYGMYSVKVGSGSAPSSNSIPLTPTNVSALASGTQVEMAINVSWTPVVATDLMGYTIYYASGLPLMDYPSRSKKIQNNPSASGVTITVGILINTTYYIVVVSSDNTKYQSPVSAEVSVYTSSFVITAINIAAGRGNNDTNGEPLNFGRIYRVSGICTVGDNTFDPTSANHFYLQDETGGVKGYNLISIGRVFQLGEKYTIEGTVGWANGITQLSPVFVSTDGIVAVGDRSAPWVVRCSSFVNSTNGNDGGELLEGRLLKIKRAQIYSGDWKTPNASSNMTITDDGGVTISRLYIDGDTNIDDSPFLAVATGYFDVMGIGAQYDTSTPYLEDYQIIPRSTLDIIEIPTNIVMTRGNQEIKLDWPNCNDPEQNGYRIYRSSVSGGSYTAIATQGKNMTTFTDDNDGLKLELKTTYYYVITMLQSGTNWPGQDESSYSDAVSTTAVVGASLYKINIVENRRGTDDVISGPAGALPAGATVQAWDTSVSPSVIITSVSVSANGSFSLSLGDNKYRSVYVMFVSSTGEALGSFNKSNDIDPPVQLTITSNLGKSPEKGKVSLIYSYTGSQDYIEGGSGAAGDDTYGQKEPRLTQCRVYVCSKEIVDDGGKTEIPIANIISSATVKADGSFGPILIGDDRYREVWIAVEDPAYNRSLSIKMSNAARTESKLYQNAPNPFKPSVTPFTIVRYDVGADLVDTPVTLYMYNIAGELVKVLVDEPKSQGAHHIKWYGDTGSAGENTGNKAGSGVYIYHIKIGADYSNTKKLILIR